jgi:hypothetical protein
VTLGNHDLVRAAQKDASVCGHCGDPIARGAPVWLGRVTLAPSSMMTW